MTNLLPLTESLDFCPLCYEEEFTRVHNPDICQCKKCRVYFRNPRPDQGFVLESYNEGVTFRQWQNELEIRAYLWNKRLSLVSTYQSSGALLDIGTGDGYFLNFAKTIFDVDATEVSKYGIELAIERGHTVHHGTIFDVEFDTKKFDVITMWHVLEHLPEPGRVLDRARTLLKKDGLLVIAVPNETIPCILAQIPLIKDHPFGRLSRGQEIHLIHFTPQVLTDVLRQKFGFKILGVHVDDVHIYKRKQKLPAYFVNRVCSRLFNRHLDTAMTIICTPT